MQTDWSALPILMREKHIRASVLPISHGALRHWVKAGKFPPPIKLSAGVTVWRRSDVEAWAEEVQATQV